MLGIALLCASFAQGAETPPVSKETCQPIVNETQAAKDQRMKWFREARLGMFIHWGVYTGCQNGDCHIAGDQSSGEHPFRN